MSDIPDWVRTACRRWGRQKRRIWSGKDWHGNIDGYAQSFLGRILDEREGTGQGARAQRWPEVFWGDGLAVQRVLAGLPENPYDVLHLHFVFDPEWGVSASRKARLLQLSRPAYHQALNSAEYWVWAKLEAQAEKLQAAQVVGRVNKIIRNMLQSSPARVINSQTG